MHNSVGRDNRFACNLDGSEHLIDWYACGHELSSYYKLLILYYELSRYIIITEIVD